MARVLKITESSSKDYRSFANKNRISFIGKYDQLGEEEKGNTILKKEWDRCVGARHQ